MKVLAILLGVLCHTLFAVAVGLMGYSLFWGLSRPIIELPFSGIALNLFLLIGFPLGHSMLLSTRGRHYLKCLLPTRIGSDMVSTTFAISASLQVGALFAFWRPLGGVWIEPQGVALFAMSILYVFAWLGLLVALAEAGLQLQTGALGWFSVVKGVRPTYPALPQKGLHGLCRHPIYQSFLLILLTGPTWGLDHLLIASVWGGYCIVGPIFKERRLRAVFGNRYDEYSSKTPYYAIPLAGCRGINAPNERTTGQTVTVPSPQKAQ